MKPRQSLKWCSVVLMTVGLSAGAFGETKPDNTKKNKTIQNKGAVTAEDQSNASSDLNLAAKIRSAIVDDDSISTYGHNVKVIVNEGAVVLKGPVETAAEKEQIEQIATKLAGATNVRNELEIAR